MPAKKSPAARNTSRPMPRGPHVNPKAYPFNAHRERTEPEPLKLHVVPALAPLMLAKLDKLLNTRDGAQRSVAENEIFATTVDGVPLNGDDHQVLGFLKGALVEAMTARLRGER